MDDVYRQLLRRAEKAVGGARSERRRAEEVIGGARREHRRATDLVAVLRALQNKEPGGIVRCAWCGRIAAGDEWMDTFTLGGGNLHQRLRRNASHGICPACFERVWAETEQQRSGSPVGRIRASVT